MEIALTEGPDRAPRFAPNSTGVFFVRGAVVARRRTPAGDVRAGRLPGLCSRRAASEGRGRRHGGRCVGRRLAHRVPAYAHPGERANAGALGGGKRRKLSAPRRLGRRVQFSLSTVVARWDLDRHGQGSGQHRLRMDRRPRQPGHARDPDYSPLRPESARFRTSRGRATAAPSSTAGGNRPSYPPARARTTCRTCAPEPSRRSRIPSASGTGLDIAGPGRLVVESLSVPTNLLEVPLTNAPRAAEVADAGIAGQLPARRLGGRRDRRLHVESGREHRRLGVEPPLERGAPAHEPPGERCGRLPEPGRKDAAVVLERAPGAARSGEPGETGAQKSRAAFPTMARRRGEPVAFPRRLHDRLRLVQRREAGHLEDRGGRHGREDLLAPGRNILPEISPDGAWVSFVNQVPVPTIEVVRLADGAPVFRIPNIPAGRGFIAGRHRWLPDGPGIAFLGGRGARDGALRPGRRSRGQDTAATRRKVAVFEPDVELHSFGLAPDMSFAVVAARQATSNLLEIDGLPHGSRAGGGAAPLTPGAPVSPVRQCPEQAGTEPRAELVAATGELALPPRGTRGGRRSRRGRRGSCRRRPSSRRSAPRRPSARTRCSVRRARR